MASTAIRYRQKLQSKAIPIIGNPKSSHPNCNIFPAGGKTISGSFIDNQIDKLVKSLVLLPSWKENIIERLTTVSERENILNQRTQTEGKLKRLAKTYVDGLALEGDYNVQRKLLQDTLDSLVVPEEHMAIRAGKTSGKHGTSLAESHPGGEAQIIESNVRSSLY